jgi:hypothetical protein
LCGALPVIMAGAYFMAHQPMGALPVQNMGEQAALYSWVFLLLVAVGPGLWVPETRPGSRDLLIFVEETAEPVEATDAAGVGQVVFREAA